MKADAGQIGRALDKPDPAVRLILLYGPDESGSRALATRIDKGLGSDAERIDFSSAQLKGDPALLADEAASISLFGGARHIRVDPAGTAALFRQPELLDYEPVARWHALPITQGQRDFLAGRGVDPASVRDRGHAAAIMDAIDAQRARSGATLKQIASLRKFGWKDGHLMTFAAATKALDRLFSGQRKHEPRNYERR